MNGGSFWNRQGGDPSNDLVVLDNWRHRQVGNPHTNLPPGPHLAGPPGLGTLDHTLGSLASEMERNRHAGGGYGAQGAAYPKPNERALHPSAGPNAPVSLGDLHLSHGNGLSQLPLDMNPSSALHPQKTIAEVSNRRREAIKSSFRRIDVKGQGWVSIQDLAFGLQRFGHLSSMDQQRVLHGIAGNSPQRVSFAQFSVYYQLLGSTIERDRDFEDLMRHHWGFPEVSDILEDMKNKFAMVGLAYAFRHALQQGDSPELSIEAFHAAIKQVGMTYSSHDVHRVFDSFDMSGMGQAQNLEVMKLTAHLTSAARPATPVGIGWGTAHFSEVHSQASDLHQSTTSLPSASVHGMSPQGGMLGMGGLHGMHGMQNSSSSVSLHGGSGLTAGSKLAEPAAAPPETPEVNENDGGNPNAPPPQAPPEEDDEGSPAPPESSADAKLGYPMPPEAPPEDDDEMAPQEMANPQDDDAPDAPPEKAAPPSHYSGATATHSYSPGSPLKYSGAMISGGGHAMAAAAAGNGGMKGQKRAVTIGINYLTLPKGQGQLAGCINDSDTFIKLLTEEFGYKVEDIRQLRDDHPKRMPTRKNMQAALAWLVNGAKEGDHLFFHYSGHGSQQRDASHDEIDGKDECLVPCDFQHHGMIADDDIRRIIVSPLPKGVRLTCVLDCCHSGTGMDLPYKVILHTDGVSADIKKKSGRMSSNPTEGDVVMISGCKDTQTSADIGAGSAGNKSPAGAMTTAFKTVITQNATASYHDVLIDMRKFLKSRGFAQVPQLCSEHFLNLTECFMPEVEPPYEAPPPSMRTAQQRAVTIGINYLTLWPGRGRLSGCINDSDTMVGILKEVFGFQDNQILRLRDDQPNLMPSKANMMKALAWLTQGVQNGDELFLHYSGHGGQQKDRLGDERDGMDETLIPCDFQTAGQITDDELHNVLVRDLPKGVRMWVILDCCHSGTALDLVYKVRLSADGRTPRVTKSRTKREKKHTEAEVIMISGCKDDQTSADIGAGTAGAAKASGAMTTAFRHCINRSVTCEDLLVRMRTFLKRNHFDQVPQMSSEQFVQMDHSFVDYQMKKRSKRALPDSIASRSLQQAGAGAMPMTQQMMSFSPQQTAFNGSPQQKWRPIDETQMPGSPMPMSPMGGGMPGMLPLSADDLVLGKRINDLELEIAKLRTEGPAQGQQSMPFPMQSQMVPSMPPFGASSPMPTMAGAPMAMGYSGDPMQIPGGPPFGGPPGFM